MDERKVLPATKQRRPRRKLPPRAPGQGDTPATNPELRAQVLQWVDKQLTSGNPPQVRATQERLVKLGYTREGARELIANVVVSEVFDVMARGEMYNQARFFTALDQLPGSFEF